MMANNKTELNFSDVYPRYISKRFSEMLTQLNTIKPRSVWFEYNILSIKHNVFFIFVFAFSPTYILTLPVFRPKTSNSTLPKAFVGSVSVSFCSFHVFPVL